MKTINSTDYYPTWVCFPCGYKYGRWNAKQRAEHICTIHTGICDICGQERAVTEPRDFGHLKDNWKENTNDEP